MQHFHVTNEGNNNQACRLSVRIGQHDKQVIQSKAKIAGLSLSDYIRTSALQDDDRPRIVVSDAELKDIRLNLTKIGGNLNQLSRSANMHGINEYDASLHAALTDTSKAAKIVSDFIADVKKSL